MARSAKARGAAIAASSAYERRIQRYLDKHPGVTLPLTTAQKQEARGHRPPVGRTEHAVRVEKEVRRGVIDDRQRHAISRFAERQARRGSRGLSARDLAAEMRDWVRRKGWHHFEALRERQRQLARDLRATVKTRQRQGIATIEFRRRESRAQNEALMDLFVDENELPDWEWLFYH